MLPISDLTYKVVAYQEFTDTDPNEYVEWALEMIELGHESDSLFILAGLSQPVNYFEAVRYLRYAIEELGLQVKMGKAAIISCGYYYVKNLTYNEKLRSNLKALADLFMDWDSDNVVYDFYLLYWAWDDLDYSDTQHYWDGATRENIEQLVIDRAKQWVRENELVYTQSLYR